jgi:NAD(P)-dependent dehydrogenase (short-subunit alcohol dehydrogenase family)
LVNNAGLAKIPKRRLTKEGAEMQWGVNHLGHFYLTYLLWSKIRSSAFFRIVNVSSMGHKQMFGVGPQPTVDWQNINF